MALINKFPYKEMKRETTTEGRKYVAPDGEKLPSVTTILDATKPIEAKKALIEWRRRVGEQKAKEYAKKTGKKMAAKPAKKGMKSGY